MTSLLLQRRQLVVDIAVLCAVHDNQIPLSRECGIIISQHTFQPSPHQLSHHQADMAWTPLLVAGVLICTIVYSDLQFPLESDPLINHNLLAYLSSREDLVSSLSSYSNNIADTTREGFPSSAGTYKTKI